MFGETEYQCKFCLASPNQITVLYEKTLKHWMISVFSASLINLLVTIYYIYLSFVLSTYKNPNKTQTHQQKTLCLAGHLSVVASSSALNVFFRREACLFPFLTTTRLSGSCICWMSSTAEKWASLRGKCAKFLSRWATDYFSVGAMPDLVTDRDMSGQTQRSRACFDVLHVKGNVNGDFPVWCVRARTHTFLLPAHFSRGSK